MFQFLNILNDVMRIATFQWCGDARHGRVGDDRQGAPINDAARTDRRPIRRSRP